MKASTRLSRRQVIEKRATELFRDRGYSATTMRDLAQSLGVEAASLYSHIRSKEDILRRVCFDTARQFFEGLDAATDEQLPAPEQLDRFVLSHVTVVTKNLSSSAVFSYEWRHLSEPYLSEFLQQRRDYEERFRQVIRQGIAAGAFTEADPKLASVTILSALNWMHLWYDPQGPLSAAQIAQQISRMLRYGLLPSTVQTTAPIGQPGT